MLRYPVYVIRDCPFCKSSRTGRKILYTGNYPEGLRARYMKRGELVRPTDGSSDTNCFCENCGTEWYEDLKISWLSRREIETLKAHKEITQNTISKSYDIPQNPNAAVKCKKRDKEKRHDSSRPKHIPIVVRII